MVIKGKEYDILELKDDDIINERWIVANDSTSDEVCIRFCYLTDKDLESLKVCNLLADRKPNENSVWINYENETVFVDEYYHYGADREDFNGYKEFESITAAMEWCEEHTNEEIHRILSE